MAKKTKTPAHGNKVPGTSITITEFPKAPAPAPVYLVRLQETPPLYVGSPMSERVGNPELAASWKDESDALNIAKLVKGQVIAHVTKVAVDPIAHESEGGSQGHKKPADGLTTTASADMSPRASRKTRAKKAPEAGATTREQAIELCMAAGLPLHEKGSSTHAGHDPKGARLVIPRGAGLARVFVYKLEDAKLPGFLTTEQRDAKGYGGVTHELARPTLEQLAQVIEVLKGAGK